MGFANPVWHRKQLMRAGTIGPKGGLCVCVVCVVVVGGEQ